tara:strand:+ start:1414 stop:1596 length:183 start_codon:yes stop_codon:yes gene_type:complete
MPDVHLLFIVLAAKYIPVAAPPVIKRVVIIIIINLAVALNIYIWILNLITNQAIVNVVMI